MTTETVTPVITNSDRANILAFASCLLWGPDRQPATVIAAAQPLLEWAGQAAGREDGRARMNAMERAFFNDQKRLGASLAPERLTPEEFIAQSRAYYTFITGGEA
jgi:hypothetical protein